jgi:hypothetical protein
MEDIQESMYFTDFLNIFLIIWQIIRLFEILADLATNRRALQRPSCATAVCNATAMANGGKGAANGPLRERGPRQPTAVAHGGKGGTRRGPRR